MAENVVILGATGSIGLQSLDVVDSFGDRFRVTGLTARKNSKLLAELVAKYKPKYVWISEEKRKEFEGHLKDRGGYFRFEYVSPSEQVALAEVSLVVSGIPGFASVEPVFRAVESGKKVAVASKEAILCSGELLFRKAEETGAKILPVDSEHSSLWKLLDFYPRELIKKVFITASGGPFLNSPREEIENAPFERVIKHPIWNMGVKITVDSALLMNKAFEIVEACYLFSLSPSEVGVKVHPEAVVHSAVELKDGTVVMSAHYPDMRVPIMYAMLYPDVPDLPFNLPSLWEKPLRFFEPDLERFPALKLGWKCAELRSPFPCIMVSADEVAVEKFIERKIRFWDIYLVVERTISFFEKNRGEVGEISSFDDVLRVHNIARKKAESIACEYEKIKDMM